MRATVSMIKISAAAVILCGCTTVSEIDIAQRTGAPLLEGMGGYHRAISSPDPFAQRYFDQGMVMAFGFNHAESARSFRAAQILDPDCAICYWGEAMALGPNINVTANGKAIMSPEDQEAAFAAITRAQDLSANASSLERELIDALATRYAPQAVEDRDSYDLAYAQALGVLHEKYPADDDIAAMFAEAWMNTMPWDYWSDAQTPRPETIPVINALEQILERNDQHPLALHLYIHAVEASSNPGRAESAADMLADLVPGSGHLVHMPSHIYWRVGRYGDASAANVRAAASDEDYIAQCNAQGLYPAMYYPHNIHFLWAASSMEGRSAVAIEAAWKVAENVRLEQIEQFPSVEFFKTIPLLALTQFGHWDEILAEPRPPENLDYSTAIWHYARGIAFAKTGDAEAAAQELAELRSYHGSVSMEFLDTLAYPATTLLGIADALLTGEIALASGNQSMAIANFLYAVNAQDELPYMEPPFWYYPSRQSLGVALIEAGRYAEAERVYRQDLVDYPRNGWSFFGLMQALQAQGRSEEAADARAAFERIWAQADVSLSASRI